MRDALGRVRRVLVLGGDSDIGAATVRALIVRRGVRHVILAGRDEDALRGRGERIATGSDREVEVDVRAFDVLDEAASHRGLVDAVWDEHGDIDVVLHCVGILGDQATAERDPDHALDVLRTNHLGAVSVLLPIADRLREQGTGSLVVLSSIAAVRPRGSNFIYGSSKAGLDTFAEGLGHALDGTGAHVLVVRPGFVRTKMTAGMPPAPFAVDPADVAAAIVSGLDVRADVIYVPTALRAVASVLRVLPTRVLRRLPR